MRALLIILTIGITFTASAQKSNLDGRYRLSDKGDIYTYVFSNDSMLSIIHSKDTVKAYYRLDTAKSPMHINMAILDEDGNELYTAPGIYEWVGTDKIRLRFSADLLTRPIGFLPKGNEETKLLVKEK